MKSEIVWPAGKIQVVSVAREEVRSQRTALSKEPGLKSVGMIFQQNQ